MMWVKENSKKEWKESIDEAYSYYIAKYGHKPDICYLHPISLEKDTEGILISTFAEKGLSIEVAPYILKNCLWIGQRERDDYDNF